MELISKFFRDHKLQFVNNARERLVTAIPIHLMNAIPLSLFFLGKHLGYSIITVKILQCTKLQCCHQIHTRANRIGHCLILNL